MNLDRSCQKQNKYLRMLTEGFDIMQERFNDIDLGNEKVHRIINAAFEVFSKNDLEKASTNSIVKTAGISRGLLYHYFKDKQELFDFLTFFSVKSITIDMEKDMDWEDDDILSRMRQMLVLRVSLIDKYPYMMEFFNKYPSSANRDEIRMKTEEISPGIRDRFYNYNINYNNLKDGVEVDKLIQTIKYTLGGIAKDHWDKASYQGRKVDFELMMSECDKYIDFLRLHFYK